MRLMVSVCGQAVYTLGAGKTDRLTDPPTQPGRWVLGPASSPVWWGWAGGAWSFPGVLLDSWGGGGGDWEEGGV